MKVTAFSFARMFGFLMLMATPVAASAWDDFGVTTNINGSWNDPGNWTAGGPPGVGDNAFVGSNFPAGSAATASISLSGNTSIQNLNIGRDALASGVVDLNGFQLTVTNTLFLGQFGGTGQIVHNGGTFSAATLNMAGGSSLTMASGDVVNTVLVSGNSSLTTGSTSNITTSVLFNSSTAAMTLGADLSLSLDLDLRGTTTQAATLDANGFNITARDIFIGRFGLDGNILNDGAIVATRNLEVSGGTFALDANDNVAGTVSATNGGILDLHANTTAQHAFTSAGGRINTATTSNLSSSALITDANSQLSLGADLTLSGDLDIRGSASIAAQVLANGFDITARDIFIGRFGLTGQILGANSITATRNLEVSNSNVTLNAADSVANTITASNNGVIQLHANTAAQNAFMAAGGVIHTVAVTNFSESALLSGANSLLDLGDELSLNFDLDIRGSVTDSANVDANGFDITARDIYIGRFGLQGNILNDGAITATRNLEVSRGTFSLDADDSVAGTVSATNNGTLHLHANTAASGAFASSGGVINTVAATNLSQSALISDANSQLNLGDDLVLALDLDIRGSTTTNAIVDAGGFNITARDIYIGRFGLRGNILNVDALTATRNLEVSRGSFSLDGNDSVANTVSASNDGVLNLHATTAAQNALVLSGGRINTAATVNLANTVTVVDANSSLHLGGHLSLIGDIDLRGSATQVATLDANGFDISADQFFLGRFGLRGELLNDGAVMVNELLLDRSSTILTQGDDYVFGTLALVNNSFLEISQDFGGTTGLTLDGNLLSFLDTSTMQLTFDNGNSQGLDWAFRWLNPVAGDRLSQLNSLIGSGKIVIQSANAINVFDGGDGYTYVGYQSVPEPGLLWLTATGFALIASQRRRR